MGVRNIMNWNWEPCYVTCKVIVRPDIEKKQLSVRRLAQGMVTVRSLMYPSTNSTGRSAESMRELIVLNRYIEDKLDFLGYFT